MIGDKGYAGRDFAERRGTSLEATVVRPEPKDEPANGSDLAPLRQRIESIFWTCKDILTLERHGARTLAGLRRAGYRSGSWRLAAGISLNHQLGRPSRALVDHVVVRGITHLGDPQEDLADRVVVQSLFLASGERDTPIFEEVDVVRLLGDVAGGLLDQEYAQPPVPQGHDLLEHLGPEDGSEAERGLVHGQEPSVGHETSADCQHAGLAAAQS